MAYRRYGLVAGLGIAFGVLLAGCGGNNPAQPGAADAPPNAGMMAETQVVVGGAVGELAEVPLGAGEADEADSDATAQPASELVSHWIATGRMLSRRIVTPEGEVIAGMMDVLVSPEGEVLFLVFDAGPYLGAEDEHIVAVEWDDVRVSEQEVAVTPEGGGEQTATAVNHVFVYDAGELENAPVLDADLLAGPAVFLSTDQLELDTDEVELLRASRFGEFDLTNYRLVNDTGEELGDVEEWIIDLVAGEVVYVVSNIGGVLGIGETTLAIPWDALIYNKELETFTLPVARQTLDEAPELDLDTLKAERFPDGWDDEIAAFWEELQFSGRRGETER